MIANIIMGVALNEIPKAMKQGDGLAILLLLGIVAVCAMRSGKYTY